VALLTAAEARAYLPDLTGTADDTALTTIIARVGQALAHASGYPPASVGGAPSMESASYVRYYDPERALRTAGGVQRLHLGIWPVTAVASVYDDPDQSYGASTEIVSGSRGLDGARGVIWILPTASVSFSVTGHRAIKVAFTAGYATVPEGLKHVAAMVMRDWWAARHTPGSGLHVSAEALAALAPYRLPAGFGAGYQGEA
jgi:hypothetical protein